MGGLSADRVLSSRYECKYLVPPEMAEEMRRYMKSYMRPDPFSARRSDRRYSICSLYLDTADLRLFHQTMEGHKNRFKLRIRTYSDSPETPVFFEVKRRVDQVVLKTRQALERDQAEAVLSGARLAEFAIEDDGRNGMDRFHSLNVACGVRPIVRIRYKREAYESRSGDPVRITFDDALCHQVTLDQRLEHHQGAWTETPVEGKILEIKFTDVYPSWVGELIRAFELQKLSVAKYCMSMEHAIETGRYRMPLVADLPAW